MQVTVETCWNYLGYGWCMDTSGTSTWKLSLGTATTTTPHVTHAQHLSPALCRYPHRLHCVASLCTYSSPGLDMWPTCTRFTCCLTRDTLLHVTHPVGP